MTTTIAIMQPYFFPYIGYFQLIKAVDKFICYDDVNYIKGGWINRNRILINSKPNYITVQLIGASSNRLINEIEIGGNLGKILKTIQMAYDKAPFFNDVFPVIEDCFNSGNPRLISDLAMKSVVAVSGYLQLETKFEVSSQLYSETRGLERADRIIAICQQNHASNYINALGGVELYDKTYFSNRDLKLDFLNPNLTPYKQFNNDFIAGLSILDVLMFNDIESCRKLIGDYELM